MNAIRVYLRLPYFPQWTPWAFGVAAGAGVVGVAFHLVWAGSVTFAIVFALLIIYVGRHAEGDESQKATSSLTAGVALLLAYMVASFFTAAVMWALR